MARNTKLKLGRYKGPDSFPVAPIDELVEEGLLIAASSIRMTVKNRAILSILRDRADFDLDWYLAVAREEHLAYAREQREDAERVESARGSVHARAARASFDIAQEKERLDRRRAMLTGVAAKLDELAEDAEHLQSVALAGRDNAWIEIGEAIRAKALRSVAVPETLTGSQREFVLSLFREQLDAANPGDRFWGPGYLSR